MSSSKWSCDLFVMFFQKIWILYLGYLCTFVSREQNNDLAKEIKTYLLEKGETKVEYKKLILDGIELIEKT